jgi:hypothetical protein
MGASQTPSSDGGQVLRACIGFLRVYLHAPVDLILRASDCGGVRPVVSRVHVDCVLETLAVPPLARFLRCPTAPARKSFRSREAGPPLLARAYRGSHRVSRRPRDDLLISTHFGARLPPAIGCVLCSPEPKHVAESRRGLGQERWRVRRMLDLHVQKLRGATMRTLSFSKATL